MNETDVLKLFSKGELLNMAQASGLKLDSKLSKIDIWQRYKRHAAIKSAIRNPQSEIRND